MEENKPPVQTVNQSAELIEYKIQVSLPAPNLEIAKKVANEAQGLIDTFGYYQFLNLVEFMKANPSMVQMGLRLINNKR